MQVGHPIYPHLRGMRDKFEGIPPENNAFLGGWCEEVIGHQNPTQRPNLSRYLEETAQMLHVYYINVHLP